jgi:hypothetical protein
MGCGEALTGCGVDGKWRSSYGVWRSSYKCGIAQVERGVVRWGVVLLLRGVS